MSKPVGWFAQEEAIFTIKVSLKAFRSTPMSWPASHEDTVQLVIHIVKNTPAGNPYEELKDRFSTSSTNWTLTSFLEAHCHSLHQRQRPFSLLAAMLEYCPRGEERSQHFACLFLRPLPRELRILLMHKEPPELHTHHQEVITVNAIAFDA
jgi:hypothetical protein